MKVVHLSTTDYGGAYEAAQRISDSLTSYGIESFVMVRTKNGNTPTIPIYNSFSQKFLSKAKNFFNLWLSDGDIVFDKYGADICKQSIIRKADIICLHWVNSFISNVEVANILAMGKPVYWIMHDMWPFTGGCHYAGDCGQYRLSCGQCPVARREKKGAVVYWHNRKRECFQGDNLYPVGPSHWISECAKQSSIFGSKKITTIPNPINTEFFHSVPENERRDVIRRYGLSEQKVTILFAAVKINNPLKGFPFFGNAVNRLSPEKYQILILGKNDEEELSQLLRLDVRFTGFVKEQKQLRNIYSAADLLVAPSLQENYSNTVLEALACGTPAVVFDVGGMCDLVETGVNGYIARVKDAGDLCRGIEEVTANRQELGRAARERVLAKNTFSVIAEKYMALFAECGVKTRNLR